MLFCWCLPNTELHMLIRATAGNSNTFLYFC
uniref:Uncharacterized protein n=1 Tax=Anguilla anguilla TaxID=7936 RepID=A0A0E9S3N7_ANGAN